MITLALMVVAQPYKEMRRNKIEALLLIVLVLIMALFAAISRSTDTVVNAVVLLFVLLNPTGDFFLFL